MEWFSYAVTSTPILKGATGTNGIYSFATNPYGPGALTFPWHIRYPNFLVKATYNSVIAYQWMPLYDAQNVYFRNGANSAYTAEIVLPESVNAGNFEGYLDKVECNSIRCWVWDRNQPNTPLTVEFLQGVTVASATSIGTTVANIYRTDLKEAGKGNGAHGYSFTTPEILKDNQDHIIWGRVQGSNYVLKWAPKTLQCPRVNAAPIAPEIAPLSATVKTLFITSLPAFTDADNDPLTYHLTGLPIVLNFYSFSRTIAGTPAVSGTFELSYSASDSQHPAVNVTVTLTVNAAPVVTGNFEGFLDKVECSSIRGWVWDRNQPNTPLTVEFFANSVSIGTVDATIYRTDLKDAGKGNGAHGNSFVTPASLKNGTSYTISAKVQNSTYTLKWSPQTLHCPSGSRLDVLANAEVVNDLFVWPNPSKGQFEVRYLLSPEQSGELVIVDATGREWYRQQVQGIGLQLQPITLKDASGLFHLQLRQKRSSISKKIVIEN